MTKTRHRAHGGDSLYQENLLMLEVPFKNVDPVKPPAAWLGGKSKLAKEIISRINVIPHTVYAEPFVGMGGVFLRRNKAPKAEIINDYAKDVATFFRILQRHYQPFLDMLKWRLSSRAEFERLLKVDPITLTDLERAARFLYLQKTGFGGDPLSKSFGVSRDRPSRFDITKIIPLLEEVHERLSSVVIECLPFQDFITRYDTSNTLFYLDPPYYNCEDYYGKDLFSRSDFEVLATQLKTIKGRFILSLNDHPEVRRIFSAFVLDQVTVRYTFAGAKQQSDFKEVIISN